MVCSTCSKDHNDQREKYPVGSFVKTIVGLIGAQTGAIGKVRWHSDNGRAGITFGESVHLFCYPEDWIIPSNEGPCAQLREDLVKINEEDKAIHADIHDLSEKIRRLHDLSSALAVKRGEVQRQIDKWS